MIKFGTRLMDVEGTGGAGGGTGGTGAAGAAGAGNSGGDGKTGSGSGTPPPAVVSDWTGGFTEETKGYVQTKGFKDSAAVVESYRNLEKLLGDKDKLIKLPEKLDDPTAMASIWEKLGRPLKPEEYGLTTPKEGGDEAFTNAAAKAFHDQGLSRTQATKLAEWWNGMVTERQKGQQQVALDKFKAEDTKLKTEWGAAHEQNLATAQKAAETFGVTKEQIDKLERVMGFAGVHKLFHGIGSKLGEHGFIDGNSGVGFNGKLTPAQARHQLDTLSKDSDWIRRYSSGGAAEREQMERLQKYANPESA